MNSRFRFALAVLLAPLAVWAPATASAQGGHCSKETLRVRGTPVTATYCATGPAQKDGGGEILVPVSETYTAPSGSTSANPTLHFVASEGPSRVIENVPLAKLNLTGTLHLTLVYGGGVVRIESAMLTPGAVQIK